MKRNKSVFTALVFIGILSISCNLLALVGNKNGPVDGQSSSGTIYDEQGNIVALEPPAQDILTVITEMTDAGEISQGEALVAALKLLVGEEGDNLFKGKNYQFLEGTALVDTASQYLENGEDEQAKDEIRRLLNMALPERENMERFSAPEEGASGRQNSLAPVGKGIGTACRALWADGFPVSADALVCLLYRTNSVAGGTTRVYYAESRRSDSNYLTYVNAADEALQDSLTAYSGLTSTVHDIDLIFALVPSGLVGSSGPPRGLTDWIDMRSRPDTLCPIILFPAALTESISDFKQVVAHEVFHCVQAWEVGPFSLNDAWWYTEGAATYFSNVVYPTNNLEYRFIKRFGVNSLEESLFDMTYENSPFFQYLSNQWGDQKVFDMVMAFDPIGTNSAHAATMASYGIDNEFFQRFGQAYLDKNIIDSGGGPLPIVVYYRGVDMIVSNATLNYSAHPFHLARYLVKYKEKTDYEFNSQETGNDGRTRLRDWPEGGDWQSLPGSFRSACGDDGDTLLMTTVEMGGDYALEIDATVGASYYCRCIVGTWVQDSDEMARHVRASLGSSGLRLVSLSGQSILVVDEAGNITFTPQDYQAVFESDGQRFNMQVAGLATSTYTLAEGAEDSTIIVTAGETNFVISSIVDGVAASFPLDAGALAGGPFSEGGTFNYTCDETRLTTFIPAGVAPFSDSTFTRISDIPATPMPAPELESPPGGGDAPPDIGSGGAGCSGFTISGFTPEIGSVSWTLTNSSSQAYPLKNLSLQWPASNGSLTSITLAGAPIWTGSIPPDLAIIDSGWLGSEDARTVQTGTSSTLTLTFTGSAMGSSGYIMAPEFENGCITADVR
ncbi:MAG: hypothetical protein GXP40_11475 [Chloroflexi bacterium]|nr:hypothetical protein [Chloroflexota bacterium]